MLLYVLHWLTFIAIVALSFTEQNILKLINMSVPGRDIRIKLNVCRERVKIQNFEILHYIHLIRNIEMKMHKAF